MFFDKLLGKQNDTLWVIFINEREHKIILDWWGNRLTQLERKQFKKNP